MSQSKITSFLTASVEERIEMAMDKAIADDLRAYLGEAAYQEYMRLAGDAAKKLTGAHLGVRSPKNLIFVPGVMGSSLKSSTLDDTFWVDVRTRTHINDLRLAADGEQDADENFQVIPGGTDPSYEPFLLAVLGRDDFGHVTFPYDWRKDLRRSSTALRDNIEELYDSNGEKAVHLVAHSIWKKVGQIVFIGTPHYGSPAIGGYLKNHLWGYDLMALLGLYLSRETFRSLWGVLSLLPAPRGLYPGTRENDPQPWKSSDPNDSYPHPCVNFDMYKAESWKLDLSPQQTRELQAALDAAASFHHELYEFHQRLSYELKRKMAVIAGVGYETLFRLEYDTRFFGLWEYTKKETGRIAGNRHREGDGRVPLASAMLEGVRETRYVKGVHGELPMLPQVYEDVFLWLNDMPMKLPATPSGALGQHLAPGKTVSQAPHLTGLMRNNALTGDSGYWNLDAPDPAHMEELKAKLEAEHLPEFIKIRLL